jgi:RHS repeat-associated protein
LRIVWSTAGATVSAPTGSTTIAFNANGQIGSVTNSAGAAWTFSYTYPSGGGANLARITDAAGNKTDFTPYGAGACGGYAGACLVVGRKLTTVSPDGSRATDTVNWTLGFDSSGRVTSVANPLQSATSAATFAYGSTYASGSTTELTSGDSASAAPALTTTFNLTPDAQGRVRSLVRSWTAADQAYTWTTIYTYFADGELESVARQIDATGHISTKSFTYNGTGEVTSETDPLTASTSYKTTYTYDTDNNLQTQTVAGDSTSTQISVETAYFYDTAGRLSCKVENLTVDPTQPGVTCDAVNGPQGIPAAGSDSNLVTLYAYDASNNLISQTDPLGIVTRFGYDSVGNRTSTTQNYVQNSVTDTNTVDATNVTTTYAYDQSTTAGKSGLVTSEIDPITARVTPAATATTTFTYDALGNLLSKTVPGDDWVSGSETIQSYNEYGDQISRASCAPAAASNDACVSGALSKTVTTRDQLSRSIQVTDTTAGSTDKSATVTNTKTAYDLAGNAYKTTTSDGIVTTRSFDGQGRVLTEQAGVTVFHTYDGLGDEIRTVAPASDTTTAITTRVFYPSGSLWTSTSDDAGTTTYLYDAIGRQIGSVDAAGLTQSSTLYDHQGRVTSATTTNTVSALDGSGTTQVQTTVETEYDRDGRIVSTTQPYKAGEPQIYTRTDFDALGRPISTISNYDPASNAPDANVATHFFYDQAGDQIAVLSPKGIVNRTVYAVTGQVAETITNCTQNGTNDGSTPPADPAACVGAGVKDGSNNIIAKSQEATGSGELTTTQTLGNVTTTTTTDGDGRVVKSIVDPGTGKLSLESDYAYDSAGRLYAQATPNPSGQGQVVKRVVYDGETGRISKTIENCTDTSAPTVWSECTGTAGQDGTHNLTTTYGYDTAGNLDDQVSPSGAETTYTYDAAGRVVTSTAKAVKIASTTNSTVAVATDITTKYFYDAAGRNVAVATPNDLVSSDGITYSYTVTRYAYDAAGHVVAKLDNCTQGGQVPSGNAIATCIPGSSDTIDATTNVLTTYKYDALGNLISVTAPSPADTGASTAKVTTMYAYDTANRLCRVLENAQSNVTSLTCDSTVAGTETTNVSTTYTYDTVGRLVSQTQAAQSVSGSTTATTTYKYDGAGHLISETDPDGNIPNANQAAHTTTFTYDVLGHRSTETDPDTTGGSTIAWLYDAAGRLCRRVVAATSGHLPDLTGLSSPCTDSVSAAAIDTRYAYDAAGNVASATDAITHQTVTAAYDAVNRPTTVSDSGGVIGDSDPGTTYQYNSTGDATRTDPSGSYAFTFDPQGRETSMSNPLSVGAGASFGWTYGQSGALASETEPLGASGTIDLVTTQAYDPLGQLTAKTTVSKVGTTTLSTPAAYTYTHNAAGDELSATSTITGDATNGTSTYGYDALGRLAAASIPTQPTTTYGWNATADRATVQAGSDPAAKVTTYFHASGTPISDSAGGSYGSDAEGRLTAAPGQTLVWDDLGRLASSATVSGSHTLDATYSYDPLDRLAQVTSETRGTTDSTTTKYLYVGLTQAIAKTVVTTTAGTNATIHLSDASGRSIAEVWTDPNTQAPIYAYIGTNAHGDVTWTADDTGAVSCTSAYDPFGNRIAATGALPSSGWQGSLYDSNTRLYYVVARWYSPTLGRFLSVDPLAGNTSNPQSLDRYAYVSGNPLGGVDPFGTCSYDRNTNSCTEAQTVNSSSAYQTYAAHQPLEANRCLASKFHASGCVSGPPSSVLPSARQATDCANTGNRSTGCDVHISASPDLVAASAKIKAQIQANSDADTDQINTILAVGQALRDGAAKVQAYSPGWSNQTRPACTDPLCDLNNAIGSGGDTAVGAIGNVADGVNHAVGPAHTCDIYKELPGLARMMGQENCDGSALGFIAKEGTVVLIVAGTMIVCNAAFETCAAWMAASLENGQTVCQESCADPLPSLTTADASDVQHTFARAKEFGVDGNWNLGNYAKYVKALEAFTSDVGGGTIRVQGTAWTQPAILNYNPATSLLVIQHPDGSFWTAVKMTAVQLWWVANHASFGGH